MTSARVTMIRERITAAIHPCDIDIIDDSDKHIGHAGARAGGGHYTVHIVAEAFSGKGMLERHRMVYATVDDLMQSDIHALSIKAFTPDEINTNK